MKKTGTIQLTQLEYIRNISKLYSPSPSLVHRDPPKPPRLLLHMEGRAQSLVMVSPYLLTGCTECFDRHAMISVVGRI